MNLLQRIGSALFGRSVAATEAWFPAPTLAGVAVNPTTAMAFGTVFSGVSVLSADVAAVPIRVVRRIDGGAVPDPSHPVNDLVEHAPDDERSALAFRQTLMWHCLVYGNGYAEIERDSLLRPVKLHLLDPTTTQAQRTGDGQLYYNIGKARKLPADVFHVAGVGFDGVSGASPVTQCHQTLGISIAVEAYGASYFGNGTQACGFLSTDKGYDEEEAKQLRKSIEEQHQGPGRANRLMMLWAGMQFTQATNSPQSSQFIETRKYQLEEVCRILNMPPTKLQDFSRATFGNIEEINLNYYQSSLLPWVRRFQVEYNRKLFTKAERRVYSADHDPSFPLQGRMIDRANYAKILAEIGFINRDQGRASLGLGGPIEGGEVYLVPLNYAPLDKVADASIETLKGVKPVEPPADQPRSLPEPASPAALPDLLTPARSVVMETGRRMANREATGLRASLRKGDLPAVLTSIDARYAREASVLADAFTTPLAMLSSVLGRPIDPADFARRSVERSNAAILRCVEGEGTIDALNALADEWAAGKAEEISLLLEEVTS